MRKFALHCGRPKRILRRCKNHTEHACPCRITLCIGGAVRLELASPTFDRRSGWYAGSARPCAAIGCGSSFSRGGDAVSVCSSTASGGKSPQSFGPCGPPQDVPSDKLKLRRGTIVVLRVDGVDRK